MEGHLKSYSIPEKKKNNLNFKNNNPIYFYKIQLHLSLFRYF